jgi:hypothetical protein
MAVEQLSFYRRDEKSAGLFGDRLDFGFIQSKKAGGAKALSEIRQGGNWIEVPLGRASGPDSVGRRSVYRFTQGFIA